jgi:hypothetical protein
MTDDFYNDWKQEAEQVEGGTKYALFVWIVTALIIGMLIFIMNYATNH